MAAPLIGDRPMTNTERTRRKRQLDKAKIERAAELEAENDHLRRRVSDLSDEILTLRFGRKLGGPAR